MASCGGPRRKVWQKFFMLTGNSLEEFASIVMALDSKNYASQETTYGPGFGDTKLIGLHGKTLAAPNENMVPAPPPVEADADTFVLPSGPISR